LVLESASHQTKPLVSNYGKPLAESEKELSDLWTRVIIQSIRDAGSANIKTRAEIFRWVNTVEYRRVTKYAGINGALLKKGLIFLIQTSENYPRLVVNKSIEILESELQNMKV
jgi:hypothetical protein